MAVNGKTTAGRNKQSVFSARKNQEDGIKEADHSLCVAYKGEDRAKNKEYETAGEKSRRGLCRTIQEKEIERKRERKGGGG